MSVTAHTYVQSPAQTKRLAPHVACCELGSVSGELVGMRCVCRGLCAHTATSRHFHAHQLTFTKLQLLLRRCRSHSQGDLAPVVPQLVVLYAVLGHPPAGHKPSSTHVKHGCMCRPKFHRFADHHLCSFTALPACDQHKRFNAAVTARCSPQHGAHAPHSCASHEHSLCEDTLLLQV